MQITLENVSFCKRFENSSFLNAKNAAIYSLLQLFFKTEFYESTYFVKRAIRQQGHTNRIAFIVYESDFQSKTFISCK